MESANQLKVLNRQQTLLHWLKTVMSESLISFNALPGDASFRRYYRVTTTSRTYIAMDAPPPQENCYPFIAIAHALRNMQLQTPEIIAANETDGFLLLTDFGDQLYLKILTPQNADLCYESALTALAKMQRCRDVAGLTLPLFNVAFMQQEWAWHKEWFLEKLLQMDFAAKEAKLDDCFAIIAEAAANQPQVFMHRDYHSANLMWLPNQSVGILDFQDAFIGPVTYDLVSLLRDCYIDWPHQQVKHWALSYLQKLKAQGDLITVDAETFLRWFDWMGIERHLKALFTFARKQVRDQQSAYLKHIPRTLNYIEAVSQQYPELASLHQFVCDDVQPTVKKVLACAQ